MGIITIVLNILYNANVIILLYSHNILIVFCMGLFHFKSHKKHFQLDTEHSVRIKILKPQGVSYSDIS